MTDRRKKKRHWPLGFGFFLVYYFSSSKASGLALNHSVLVKKHVVVTVVLDV